jgi:hypothetical protein
MINLDKEHLIDYMNGIIKDLEQEIDHITSFRKSKIREFEEAVLKREDIKKYKRCIKILED